MHVINLAGASSVKNPRTGETHEADPDGVFRGLSLDFAHELVTRHASQWREQSAHEAAVNASHVEQLRNPHVLPKVVADLRDRAAQAEARLAALERLAGVAPADDSNPVEPVTTGAPEPVTEKPQGARKRTTAKTAAKPTGKRTAAKPKDAAPAEEPLDDSMGFDAEGEGSGDPDE